MILGLFFRLLNTTPERLHFRGDQATSSLRAKEIYEAQELTLIGIPITSFSYDGHEARVSSTAYYLQLIPLVLGNFDPYLANRAMAILGTVMILPLYWGAKMLARNTTWAAALVVAAWALLPNYVQFTTFLWNPNSQLLLVPVVVLCMGLFEKKRQNVYLGLVGLVLGLALTLHFQFGLAVVGVLVAYSYVLKKRQNMRAIFWLLGGLVIGFSPILLSEILTDFYNVRIFSLILTHLSEVEVATGPVGVPLHYVNSSVLLLLVGGVVWLERKMSLKKAALFLIALFVLFDAWLFLLPSAAEFSLIEPPRENWNFKTEERVNELITSKNPQDFNIYNLAYQNGFAEIQKYLLAIYEPELYGQMQPSYYENSQLFIMARNDEDLSKSINYEIYTFVPTKTETFAINEMYVLHYWERE